jgi:predicted DNA-binding protein (UPF0251 family)
MRKSKPKIIKVSLASGEHINLGDYNNIKAFASCEVEVGEGTVEQATQMARQHVAKEVERELARQLLARQRRKL